MIFVILKRVRTFFTSWSPKFSINYLNKIREKELQVTLPFLGGNSNKVLEIGAGSGYQSKVLASLGYDVTAIDINNGNYLSERIWGIIDYDVVNIPFADNSFDVVYSSNVMEHVQDLTGLNREIYRVLKSSGVAVHLMPSPSWRFFTTITHFIKFWTISEVHGENSKNIIEEIYHFITKFWVRIFEKNNFKLRLKSSTGLFYTGSSLLGIHLTFPQRKKLPKLLGSSCHKYILQKN